MTNFNLMQYLDLHGGETRTVFGAWNTGLGRGDFLYLDYVLYEHNKLSYFLELGTMHGLTTLYLGVTAALRDGWADSYDIQRLIPDHIREASSRLPIAFLIGDVLEDDYTIGHIRSKIGNSSTLLFCDNGVKEKEVELYAPYLGVGSVLLVHDCWTEVKPNNIAPYLTGYEAYGHDAAEAMNSYLRAWRKVA